MPIRNRVHLNSPPVVISKRIADTREARGLTPSQLAKLVGVTPTAVWNWEKNGITLRRPALEQIAKVLGVSPSFLLTGKEELMEIEPTRPPAIETVSSILEETRARLSVVTGLAPERVKVNVQFVTE